MEKKLYQPQLSSELRTHMTSSGTLDNFLNDYRQMCNNFKPSKIYIAGEETKPESFEQLDKNAKIELCKLGQSYAQTLHQLLELGLRLDHDNREYAVIGGFGVLGHLYDHNHKFALKWRGTEDIDIVSFDNITPYLLNLGFHKVPSERVDKSMIPDGRLDTFILGSLYHDRPIKVQDRSTIKFPMGGDRDESQLIKRDKETVALYGVPIQIASRSHLIRTKTGIRRRRNKLGSLKDKHDIFHLERIRRI